MVCVKLSKAPWSSKVCAESNNDDIIDAVAAILPTLIQLLSRNISSDVRTLTKAQAAIRDVLIVTAKSNNDKLAGAVGLTLPTLVGHLYGQYRTVQDIARDLLKVAVLQSENETRAKAIMSAIPTLVENLSVEAITILRVIMESKNDKIIEAFASTFSTLVQQVYSISVYDLLMDSLRSENDKLVRAAVLSMVPNLVQYLSHTRIREIDNAGKLLKFMATLRNYQPAEAFASTVPTLSLILARDTDVQIIALEVLNASAKSPNGKIAEAVATILPNLSPFLGRSWHNSKLAKAVATILSVFKSDVDTQLFLPSAICHLIPPPITKSSRPISPFCQEYL